MRTSAASPKPNSRRSDPCRVQVFRGHGRARPWLGARRGCRDRPRGAAARSSQARVDSPCRPARRAAATPAGIGPRTGLLPGSAPGRPRAPSGSAQEWITWSLCRARDLRRSTVPHLKPDRRQRHRLAGKPRQRSLRHSAAAAAARSMQARRAEPAAVLTGSPASTSRTLTLQPLSLDRGRKPPALPKFTEVDLLATRVRSADRQHPPARPWLSAVDPDEHDPAGRIFTAALIRRFDGQHQLKWCWRWPPVFRPQGEGRPEARSGAKRDGSAPKEIAVPTPSAPRRHRRTQVSGRAGDTVPGELPRSRSMPPTRSNTPTFSATISSPVRRLFDAEGEVARPRAPATARRPHRRRSAAACHGAAQSPSTTNSDQGSSVAADAENGMAVDTNKSPTWGGRRADDRRAATDLLPRRGGPTTPPEERG